MQSFGYDQKDRKKRRAEKVVTREKCLVFLVRKKFENLGSGAFSIPDRTTELAVV